MTRRVVYGIGLWLTIGATAMTIAGIIIPRWMIREDSKNQTTYTYGLHSRCDSLTGTCESFPEQQDCHGDSRLFCSLWRTVGFLMNFAVILELATLVAYAVIILGGKQKRDKGWKIISSLLNASALVQLVSMAVMAHVFNTLGDGWTLERSFILCTASWSVLALTALGVGLSGVWLPEEGEYELIPGDQ